MNYEVNISAFARVLVTGAKNEQEALEIACDRVSMGDLKLDEGSIHQEVAAENLANSKRHADCIVEA